MPLRPLNDGVKNGKYLLHNNANPIILEKNQAAKLFNDHTIICTFAVQLFL